MILCVGTTPVFQRSMVFSSFTIDDVNRAASVTDYASGKSINAARVLAELGDKPLACGFAGGDRGAAMLRDLDAAGIAHQFVQVRPQTRQCITIIDAKERQATELVEESQAAAPADWDALDVAIDEHLPQAQACIFSGSLPPDAPVDFYARWAARAAAVRIPLLLDARGEPLRLALEQGGFIAKLNRDELSATLGRPLADEAALLAAMREVLPRKLAVVVTLGAGGALAMSVEGAWRVRPAKIRPVSAVGSGDAFAAGLMSHLARGHSLPSALRTAAACGAANALTPMAGFLNAPDVVRLLEQTAVEPLEGA